MRAGSSTVLSVCKVEESVQLLGSMVGSSTTSRRVLLEAALSMMKVRVLSFSRWKGELRVKLPLF